MLQPLEGRVRCVNDVRAVFLEEQNNIFSSHLFRKQRILCEKAFCLQGKHIFKGEKVGVRNVNGQPSSPLASLGVAISREKVSPRFWEKKKGTDIFFFTRGKREAGEREQKSGKINCLGICPGFPQHEPPLLSCAMIQSRALLFSPEKSTT